MHATIKKWGNSASVRIPGVILGSAALKLNDPVDIREVGGAIIITPIKTEYKLDDLLAGITKKNLHGRVDFGAPVGNELI